MKSIDLIHIKDNKRLYSFLLIAATLAAYFPMAISTKFYHGLYSLVNKMLCAIICSVLANPTKIAQKPQYKTNDDIWLLGKNKFVL